MGNLFKSLFGTSKKNKKMGNPEKTIAEYQNQYSNLDFQWLKGDDMSVIEKYKGISNNEDFIFVEFQSGRRINVNLIDEYMLTFPSPPVIKELPHSQETFKPKIDKDSAVTSIVYEDSENLQNDSPIYKLLRKQKKNMVEVSIKIKLNLPPKDLYNVLLGSFDEAEKEIIDFVLDGIDINNIKIALADSVKKSYYSEKTESKKSEKIEKEIKE